VHGSGSGALRIFSGLCWYSFRSAARPTVRDERFNR
jgi:hypothetical protein